MPKLTNHILVFHSKLCMFHSKLCMSHSKLGTLYMYICIIEVGCALNRETVRAVIMSEWQWCKIYCRELSLTLHCIVIVEEL